MFHLSFLRRCTRKLANGTVLEGTFSQRTSHLMSGVAILPDGRAYKGHFDENKGHPLPGTQLEDDGDLYRGSFNELWQRHGKGEAWLADGTHYKGTFDEDDLVEGEVRVAAGSSEVVYKGTLKDEMFVRGVLKQHDFTYTGEFEGNQPHGKGKLEFATGAVHEGTFVKGKLHGPNNKMMLEGGYVYVGDFFDGQIRTGTLYTPTYTYEGEFNSQGKAHGEGTQTHLAASPKLIFTGIWSFGSLTRGTCVDEHGYPVDWQDNHDLQQQVMGSNDESAMDGDLTVNRYCHAKANEAKQLHKDFNENYLKDATKVQQQTGTFPSKFELGYEHSIRASHDAISNAAQQANPKNATESLNTLKKEIRFETAVDDLPLGAKQAIDMSKAKMKVLDAVGAQQISSERMDEQLSRYLRDSEGNEGAADPNGLHIQGSNAPWKSFTPKA